MKKFTKYPKNITASSKIVWYLVDDFVNYTPLCGDNGSKYCFNSKEEAESFIKENNIDAVPHMHISRSVYHPGLR